MTFYQELQLNQAGSKNLLKKSETRKEKLYHMLVYLVKIAVTMVFCFSFVTVFSIVFGSENSIVGVVVLLCLMVFRNADLGIHTGQSTILLTLFFVIMTVCPHLANQLSPIPGMLINIAALAVLILFGCHNPFMFNQSTLVLGYLLLYGYDVTGKSYQMRLIGMAFGAALTCLVFYRNHKNRIYKRNLKDLIGEFDLESSRTKWQLCQIICVPIVLCIAELCNMPRAMWAGIAAMSAILPFMEDMRYRVRKRIVGNIAGVICFIALYFLLPSSIYAYIGILGGIGVGLSAKYGWQAVFNTFGALAIATESYGLKGAVSLRLIQNVFGVVFAFVFCAVFYRFMLSAGGTVKKLK
ncbi:FUSC family protein [Fusicatenibacter sp.]